MSPFSKRAAVYHEIGKLLEQFDQVGFWRALIQQLKSDVPIDHWMVLIFSASRPLVLDFAEVTTTSYLIGPLVTEYVDGFYLVDPFYISNREKLNSGFFHLSDVAPALFQQTDYYRKFFAEYVIEDEVHYNVQLDQDRTLCLSIGCKSHFSTEHIVRLELLSSLVAALMRQRMFFEEASSKLSKRQSLSFPEKINEFVKVVEPALTHREIDVIRFALNGCQNKAIAEELRISVETVKVHRRHFLRKLHVKSQAELVALCLNTPTAGAKGYAPWEQSAVKGGGLVEGKMAP